MQGVKRAPHENVATVLVDPRALAERIESRDDPRALGGVLQLGGVRSLDAEHDIGTLEHRGTRAELGACAFIAGIVIAGGSASALFDRDLGTECDELLDRFRRCRDAALARRGLPQDGDLHAVLTCGRR